MGHTQYGHDGCSLSGLVTTEEQSAWGRLVLLLKAVSEPGEDGVFSRLST